MSNERRHVENGAKRIGVGTVLLFALVLALGGMPAWAAEGSLGDSAPHGTAQNAIVVGEETGDENEASAVHGDALDNGVRIQDNETDPSNPSDQPDPSDPSDPPKDPIDLSTAIIEVEDQVFTGDALEPELVVTLGDVLLYKDVDYTAEFSNNVHVGDASVVIYGMGDYTGSSSATFAITPQQVEPSVLLSASSFVYDGTVMTPTVTVMDGDVTLQKGLDYTVEYPHGRKAVGTYTITVTLCGDYEGMGTASFKITARSLTDAKISNLKSKVYTGKKITQNPTVVVGSTKLKLNRDYTLSYKRNVSAGTATVVVVGRGNYKGKVSRSFKIARRDFSKAKVGKVAKRLYTGKAITPRPSVKWGSAKLKLNRDYTLSYKRNVSAGTATVVVVGRGNYKGKVSRGFKITRRDFSKAKVGKVAKRLYTGKAITPRPVVKWGSTTLKLNRDYTLSYRNNTALGTATIVITGKGNYTSAHKTVSFAIYQASATQLSVESIPTQYWTGSDIKPKPTISWRGRTLQEGKDYTVSYSGNRYGGTARMTITGKGGFKGSKTVTFYISGPRYYGQTVYITNTGTKYHNAWCRYLYSKRAVDLGEALWMGYEPCKVCH